MQIRKLVDPVVCVRNWCRACFVIAFHSRWLSVSSFQLRVCLRGDKQVLLDGIAQRAQSQSLAGNSREFFSLVRQLKPFAPGPVNMVLKEDGALASTVGKELCCQFVLPEIISLADDPVFRVRKAAALKIGSLCHVVGEARWGAQE